MNAQVRPVQLWRVTNNLPDHPTSRGSRAHGYLWQVMYCRLRLLEYQFLSHKKGFLCEMRQIHFDINFGNFCCRIKNSFEKSERDPHLGKQLSYSDINTISNSLYFFNILTQKVSLFADTAVSNLQFVVSERHQLAVAGKILVSHVLSFCSLHVHGCWWMVNSQSRLSEFPNNRVTSCNSCLLAEKTHLWPEVLPRPSLTDSIMFPSLFYSWPQKIEPQVCIYVPSQTSIT